MAYLDKTGLSRLWSKIKSYVSTNFAAKSHTHAVATTAADGLMAKADKAKLDGVAAGAQKNTVTGIKGNAESSYRTGNVSLTAAQVGAVQSIDITAETDFNTLYVSGKLVIYNIRVSTGANRPNNNYGILMASDCGTKKQIFYPDADENAYARHNNGAWSNYITSSNIATESANGLMSAADKAKLNKINYVFGVDATGPYIEDI